MTHDLERSVKVDGIKCLTNRRNWNVKNEHRKSTRYNFDNSFSTLFKSRCHTALLRQNEQIWPKCKVLAKEFPVYCPLHIVSESKGILHCFQSVDNGQKTVHTPRTATRADSSCNAWVCVCGTFIEFFCFFFLFWGSETKRMLASLVIEGVWINIWKWFLNLISKFIFDFLVYLFFFFVKIIHIIFSHFVCYFHELFWNNTP